MLGSGGCKPLRQRRGGAVPRAPSPAAGDPRPRRRRAGRSQREAFRPRCTRRRALAIRKRARTRAARPGSSAADARENGDGRELALAKVAARLLGHEPDDVFRRAERERRRKARWRNAVIAVLALLAVTATGSAVYAWQQLKTNEAFLNATLKRATEIIDQAVAQAEKYNVPRAATLGLLTKAEGLFDDMAQYGRPTPELRYRKAWMLIQFARNYEILGDTGKQFARANEAQRLLIGLAAEKADDLTYQRDLSVAYHGVGDVLVAQGNLPEALKSYRDGLAIRERLAKADPSNARLAARSLGIVRQHRQRAGGAGQPAGGAEILPRRPRHQRAAGEGRSQQRGLAARSVSVSYDRSATCWWRRATCRRR